MNLLRIVLLAATLASPLHVQHAHAEPFQPFIGTWIGKASRKAEPGGSLRCTATNRPSGGDIQMTIRCGTITISATLRDTAGKLSGTWTSAYVSGSLAGIRRNNTISMRITSSVFSADITVIRRGRALLISLNPSLGERITVAMTQ